MEEQKHIVSPNMKICDEVRGLTLEEIEASKAKEHGNGCRCDNCELKKISGIKASETIFEEQKHVLNCHCDDCVGNRQAELLDIWEKDVQKDWVRQLTPKEFADLQRAERIAAAKKWEHERRERQHLEHPFYKDANVYREDVRKEQILKGAHKYPEPFNPKSWTAKELLQHAMQENVDQAHYIFGMYEKVSAVEEQLQETEYLRRENSELKKEVKDLKAILDTEKQVRQMLLKTIIFQCTNK